MKASVLLSTLILSLFSIGFATAQMDSKFYQPSKTIIPLEFQEPLELIKLPVDQDTITAYIAKPHQKQIKKTIIFFHGSGGNVSTYQFMTKPLVEAGYQLIMVDVRGYGKSTGQPTHENVKADAQILFNKIMERPDVKNTKVYIYGASLGTQVATILAKENSAKVSGLILDSPMESFNEVAKVFAPQYAEYIDQIMTSPYSAKEDLKTLEGLPKLIIHSKTDKTIPYKQGQSVYETAANPKRFIESKGDHLEGMTNNKEEILLAISQL